MTDAERIERTIAQLRKTIATGGYDAAEIRDMEASIVTLTKLLEKTK